jgi:hypothetical protein
MNDVIGEVTIYHSWGAGVGGDYKQLPAKQSADCLILTYYPDKDGGGKGIRTLGPSVANAVLSQLSYAPTGFFGDLS